jgi:hypothetical protein
VSEALGIEARRDARHYTSFVDLNRFVDASRPESETVRRMAHAASGGSAANLSELRTTLSLWAANDARLQTKGELAGLSRNLSILGSIGLRTLEYLDSGQAPAEGWIAKQMSTVSAIEKPLAEVNLAATRVIRILLERAARTLGSGGNK